MQQIKEKEYCQSLEEYEGNIILVGINYNKKTKKYLLLDSNYLPKRATSAFGDWIKVDRLLSGALESQYFYFFKLSEK